MYCVEIYLLFLKEHNTTLSVFNVVYLVYLIKLHLNVFSFKFSHFFVYGHLAPIGLVHTSFNIFIVYHPDRSVEMGLVGN